MVKFFLIALLGSASGNTLMLPSASYSIEGGVQRGSFSLGLDMTYMSQDTKTHFRRGDVSMMSLIPTFTVIPQMRSNLKPYLGFGMGYVKVSRDLDNPYHTTGWKEWETLDDGWASEFKGGIEYRVSKHLAIKAGIKELIFSSVLTEHRQQYPKYQNSLDYVRSRDINLDTLIGEFGLKWSF